jgi:hypothetical protein
VPCRLTFKKAFGIDTVPVGLIVSFTELGTNVFTVPLQRRTFEVRRGQFGVNNYEKFVIGLFKHSDERDPRLISPLMTLDISMEVDPVIPPDVIPTKYGAADAAVEPFINEAFIGLQHFLEAYRDARIVSSATRSAGRRSAAWAYSTSLSTSSKPISSTLWPMQSECSSECLAKASLLVVPTR